MLNLAGNEISNARKYKNIKQFSIFKVQISRECYFTAHSETEHENFLITLGPGFKMDLFSGEANRKSQKLFCFVKMAKYTWRFTHILKLIIMTVQILPPVYLCLILGHNDSCSTGVKLRTSSSTNHLENLDVWVLLIYSKVVEHRRFYNYQVGWEIYTHS